ncbi:MAG: cyclic nucleotide-binding domain-containing protein [Candidatus Zixiibacteriota bacterium]|nr:MAG: cyclic nucleotide-binding domain-containing protein [candidate division Zixibacteria bacterium]
MSIGKMLRGHDIFQSLNLDETNEISSFSSVKKYRADETVFAFNDPAGHVYMLMAGSVYLRLPAKSSDLSLVISEVEKGELFGLSPLLDSPRYTATALCSETTELLSIEAKPLRELLKRNSHVGFNVMNQVAHIYFTRYINVLRNLQGVVSQLSLIR